MKIKAKILPCDCHKIDSIGRLFSSIGYSYKKGHVGRFYHYNAPWRETVVSNDQDGYKITRIHERGVKIHRLVAGSFIPNPMGFYEVQHKNGVPYDNRMENLKWGSQKMNAADRTNQGKTARGSKNGNSKLAEFEVSQIKKLYPKLDKETIAKKFRISVANVGSIIYGKTWRQI